MKTDLLLFVILILCLCGCINQIEDEQELYQLTIHIDKLVSMEPMDEVETKSITLSDNAASISVWAVGEDGSVKSSQTQSSTESNFGKVTFSLPYGDYTIVSIAHNGEEATYDNGIIRFSDGKVTDSFVGKSSVSLNDESSSTASITLQRRVAKLSVKVEDALPDDIKDATFELSGYSSGYDVIQEKGIPSENFSKVFDLSEKGGKRNISFAFYTFLPSDTHNTGISVTMTNTSGQTVYQDVFTDISLVECTHTTLHGNFFTSDVQYDLQLTGDWLTPIDIPIN